MTVHTDLTERERASLRAAVSWSYPPRPDQERRRQAADYHAVMAVVERILAARAPSGDTAAQARLTIARVRVAADLTVDNVRWVHGDAVADFVASSLHDHLAGALAQAPDPDTSTATVPVDVFDAARAERTRAHEKHGENSMESVPWNDPTGRRLRVLVEEVGEVAKENDAEVEGRPVDGDRLAVELVQVCAMAAAWADAARLRDAGGEGR